MFSIQPQRPTCPTARPPNDPADCSNLTKPTLPDDVLVRVVQAARPAPLELVAWQAISPAFRRVCTDNAVWAGRAHSPAQETHRDAIWTDIQALIPQAKDALALIWRSARARSVPERCHMLLVHRQVAFAAHLNAPWLLASHGSPFWADRPFMADLARHGHLSVRRFPAVFADDTEMLRTAFDHDRLTYGLLPHALKSDPKIAWAAVAHHGSTFRDVPPELRTKDLGHLALLTYANALPYAPEPMASDRALWLKYLPRAPEIFRKASLAVRSDPYVLEVAMGCSQDAVHHIHWSAALRANLSFAGFLVAQHPNLLKNFDAAVRSDRALALSVLRHPQSIRNVHPSLYDDDRYALALVEGDGYRLKLLSPRLRQEDAILYAAIRTTPRVIMKLPVPLRARPDLVRLAVSLDASLIAQSFIRNRFCDDRDIISSALLTWPRAFRYASARLRADREISLLALERDPTNHRYLVGDLALRDAEVVAVAQGASLKRFQYASEADRDDRNKALAAVEEDGLLLECVSPRLQADVEVVNAATRNNIHAMRWAAPHLKRAWRIAR